MSLILSGTDGLSDVDGSAATPAIRGTDANTGIFFPAADTIAFTEGGVEAMRIDSSGNVGIGTVSPGVRLDVSGAAAGSSFNALRMANTDTTASSPVTAFFQSADDGTLRNRATISSGSDGSNNGYLAFSTRLSGSLAERMRIDSSGNLGIGTTSPLAKLQVKTQTNGNAAFQNSTSVAGGVKINCFNDAGSTSSPFEIDGSTLQFNIASTEKMRLDSSGNLLVGTTSVIQVGKYSCSFAGNVSNGIVLQTTFASTGTDFVRCVNSAGTAIGNITQNGATTVAYNTSSDYRLKNTITAMTGALAKVALLKPVTYKWNADGSNGEGFIAHELAEVVPDCVSGEKDGLDKDGNPKYQGIDTSFLVATLTAAIQEQQAIITQLQADVAALKGTA